MKTEESNNQHSQEKLHYESLISLFKWLISAIGILILVGLWLIGNNLSEVKQNINKELSEVKETVDNMERKTEESLESTKDISSAQLAFYRENAADFVNLTKDITSIQISAIREDAKNLALSSARRRIDEVFESNDIQDLIEKSARKEIADKLNQIVKEEIDKTTMLLNYMPSLINAYNSVEMGSRISLDLLDSLAFTHENESVRRMAHELLLTKGKHYLNAILYDDADFTSEKPNRIKRNDINIYEKLQIDKTKLEQENVSELQKLMSIISMDEDLYNITYAFLVLQEVYKVDFKNFEIRPAKDWYRKRNQ